MRIKKKHVLLESNLIDTSVEFSPQEKRLLWVLNKEFGPHDYKSFNIWESAVWLIELFDIPYDLAYEISHTYYYNGGKLFSEYKSLRKLQNTTEIFFRHLVDFIRDFKVGLSSKATGGNEWNDDSHVGILDIDFIDDDYGNYKTEFLQRNILFWNNSYGFTLYIPLNNREFGEWPNKKYIYSEKTDPRLIMVSVKFSEIKTPNEDDEYGYEGDPDKFKVDVNIRIGNDTTSGKEGGGYSLDNWMSFDVPTPKPLSKEKINDTLTGIYNDVIEKLKKTKFNLPSGVEPLNLNDNKTND